MDTEALRSAYKAQRTQLSPDAIATLSVEITGALWRLPVLARSRRIAFYLPIRGEVDCQYATRIAWDRGREAFLPVVRGRELVFAPYRPNSAFLRNRYGIPEPITEEGRFLRPQEIDVVLTPLVAFDKNGNRLGMGAGFYDRTFRFLHQRRHWNRPSLIGLAYDFQKAAKIKAYSWDVPLQKVVTETCIYAF